MKKQQHNTLKVIISGGGTGGHIFPAISIADELMKRNSATIILFVGAKGRMEMDRVPAAGYKIVGLPVNGFQRKLTLKNLKVLFNLLRSLRMARTIIENFKPDIVIGVGGYASGPVLRVASAKGIPTLLQEQNSYPGVTNKILAKKASKICVAYKNMEKYFPAQKIILTGNPVRNIQLSSKLKDEAYTYFGLQKSIPVLLVIGGSLGARTINEAMLEGLGLLATQKIQVIWQTGRIYYDAVKEKMKDEVRGSIKYYDFISRMDLAYNVADLLISRAGAISISEICLTARPAILVPSPNVAEDHQTKNALSLVNENAALMVRDIDARTQLLPKAIELLGDRNALAALAGNSRKLSNPNSTASIVDEIFSLIHS